MFMPPAGCTKTGYKDDWQEESSAYHRQQCSGVHDWEDNVRTSIYDSISPRRRAPSFFWICGFRLVWLNLGNVSILLFCINDQATNDFNYTNETTELLLFCYISIGLPQTLRNRWKHRSSIQVLFKTLFMIIYSLFNS